MIFVVIHHCKPIHQLLAGTDLEMRVRRGSTILGHNCNAPVNAMPQAASDNPDAIETNAGPKGGVIDSQNVPQGWLVLT